jgi:uncharacterized membrane protein YbaN (DUF454 family)
VIGLKKAGLVALGWLAFCLGFAGIFLPGLPTTIFWIVAALCFLKTNERMYRRIVGDKRFGPGIRLFVEEGKISRRGKWISIAAMAFGATVGALAMPRPVLKLIVAGAAAFGCLWVLILPVPEARTKSAEELDNKNHS